MKAINRYGVYIVKVRKSIYGHLLSAMVINNELESFAGNEMQTYSTINCTLHKFIEKKLSRPFLLLLYHFEIVFSVGLFFSVNE
jgi:hypothetical protein